MKLRTHAFDDRVVDGRRGEEASADAFRAKRLLLRLVEVYLPPGFCPHCQSLLQTRRLSSCAMLTPEPAVCLLRPLVEAIDSVGKIQGADTSTRGKISRDSLRIDMKSDQAVTDRAVAQYLGTVARVTKNQGGATCAGPWSNFIRPTLWSASFSIHFAKMDIHDEVLAVCVAHVAVHDAHVSSDLNLVAALDNAAVIAAVAVVAEEDVAVDCAHGWAVSQIGPARVIQVAADGSGIRVGWVRSQAGVSSAQ
eukprot:COSAG06_NODE_3086_length_5879_cov_4.176125_2_plen_250_part_01